MIDKSGYENIEIPGELDQVVQDALAEGLEQRRKNRVRDLSRRLGPMAAVFLLCTVTALKISPTFAAAACDLPVVGDCVRYSCFGSIIRRTTSSISMPRSLKSKIPEKQNWSSGSVRRSRRRSTTALLPVRPGPRTITTLLLPLAATRRRSSLWVSP